MLVQHIDVAHFDGVDIAVHVFNFALTADTVAGFEMVAVFQQRLATFFHNRVAHGEAHAVRFGQHTVAGTVSPIHKIICLLDVVQRTYKH